MEQQVIFRDYQQQLEADHNNLQTYVRDSLQHVVYDAVTKTRRYAGFSASQTGQTQVTVETGRVYEPDGAVFARRTSLVQSLTTYLPAASKRYVTLSAYGQQNEVNVETRDFLVNIDTEAVEPDEVAMTRSRDAVLVFTAGAESAEPQVPPVPATHVVIAHILLDTTQIVSVAMQTANQVESAEGVSVRTASLEAFRTALEPRITSISSQVAAITQQLSQTGDDRALTALFVDMARVKAILEVPDRATDYGADRYLDETKTDRLNSQNLGHDALVEEGIRFPLANSTLFEARLFSANDPNAQYSGGLLLPKYDDILKLSIGPYHSGLGMAQYGFRTHDIVQKTMSRQRIRYGSLFTVCTNSSWWRSGQYDPATGIFRRDGETFEVVDNPGTTKTLRLRQFWVDTYEFAYWDHVVVEHQIVGAQIAETVLIPNDFWLTRLGFYVETKAADEPIHVTICELTAGQPDLSKAILQHTVSAASLASNSWVRLGVQPTFLKGGSRYAVVLTSNANHKVGMAYGQNYVDGTFFYNTDGVYFQGDLTKDLMLELWGATFAAPQVTIELEAWNLDGGIRAVDVMADMIVPQSTQLIFEVQPNGSGAWVPLIADDLAAFNGTPPLVRARLRFVGTRDMMPGIRLTGSTVQLSRPKTAFRHISTPVTLAAASANVAVKLTLEDFNETPHDLTCRLRVGSVWEAPDVTSDITLSAEDGRIERGFAFNLAAPASSFIIEIAGTTNSAGNTFHVSERVHYVIQ